MKDYSEVTSTLQLRVVKLCDALADKHFMVASSIALGIAKDMVDLVIHISKENK